MARQRPHPYSKTAIVALTGRKEIHWRGDSREIVHDFPKAARLKLGKELTRVQFGAMPRDGDSLPTVGEGVQEIRIAASGEAFRVIYVAKLADSIYVLHAFHKKSKHGITTPKTQLEIASRRYRNLRRELKLAAR